MGGGYSVSGKSHNSNKGSNSFGNFTIGGPPPGQNWIPAAIIGGAVLLGAMMLMRRKR